MKPVWWPKDITWDNPRYATYVSNHCGVNRTQLMQDIVESCYKFYKKQHLLTGPQSTLSIHTGDNSINRSSQKSFAVPISQVVRIYIIVSVNTKLLFHGYFVILK